MPTTMERNEVTVASVTSDRAHAPIRRGDPDPAAVELKLRREDDALLRDVLGLDPSSTGTSKLSVQIQDWASDAKTGSFGKALSDVATAIQKSRLNNLLSLPGAAGGPTTATLTPVKDASLELAQIVGTVLEANSDDYVHFFARHYPVAVRWEGEEHVAGYASSLTLAEFT